MNFKKEVMLISYSNLQVLNCADIIENYALSVEDAEMLLRVAKFQKEMCIVDNYQKNIEDVNFDASIIDPPTDTNIFYYG